MSRKWLLVVAVVAILAAASGVVLPLRSRDQPTVARVTVSEPTPRFADSSRTPTTDASPTPPPPPAVTATTSTTEAPALRPVQSSAEGAGVRVARLRIPRIGVDASVVPLSVGADDVMPSPSRPMEVASYTFSPLPGQVGNVVLAGHVDFAGFGPAIFYRLRDLYEGDEFAITLSDGSTFQYRVSWVAVYSEETAPVAEIVGPTPTETATLITCTGTFDRATRAYDQRLVVRANRVN